MAAMSRPLHRRSATVALLLALGLVAAACSQSGDRQAAPTTTTAPDATGGPTTSAPPGSKQPTVPDGIRIEVLSSQPDRVSGDDARIRVTPAKGGSVADLRVRIGDKDVTGQLTADRTGREGVVKGFVEGTNTLTASGAGGTTASQLIRAWPLAGPIISGPQLALLACSTDAVGLGPATGPDCSAPVRVTRRYIGTDQQLHDLAADATQPPADVATATIGGKRVPLYVRYEQGTINRSIYEIASIDTTPGDSEAGGPGWNGTLIYRTGDGCGATFGQGASSATALDPVELAKGYALATATLDTGAVQCNDVLAAETAMMVKERAIEELGRPRATIGEGIGQGAALLHLMVQNYPGVVDGVVAALPFADTLTTVSGATDCGLLLHAYADPALTGLTDAQRQAISGFASPATCGQWQAQVGQILDPAVGCDPKIAASDIFSTANKGGVRCTLQDANRNQYGIDPKTGFAERPLDDVGVQFGLDALNAGTITPDQFLALNRSVGGYDVNGVFQNQRHAATPGVVARAYETGRVANGGGDLLGAPMIEINVDADATGDVHDQSRAFALRDRLARGGGIDSVPGLQIWTRPADGVDPAAAVGSGPGGKGYSAEAVAVMDQWLRALGKDRRGGSRDAQLARTRPDAAVDNCVLPGASSPTSGVKVYEKGGPCSAAYPVATSPRVASGGPKTDDVLKCELKPVDPSDYKTRFTSAQATRLQQVFPQGVCDYSQAGVGATAPAMPDRSYDDVETPAQRA
jgi:hypothetical protein